MCSLYVQPRDGGADLEEIVPGDIDWIRPSLGHDFISAARKDMAASPASCVWLDGEIEPRLSPMSIAEMAGVIEFLDIGRGFVMPLDNLANIIEGHAMPLLSGRAKHRGVPGCFQPHLFEFDDTSEMIAEVDILWIRRLRKPDRAAFSGYKSLIRFEFWDTPKLCRFDVEDLRRNGMRFDSIERNLFVSPFIRAIGALDEVNDRSFKIDALSFDV